MTRAWRRGQGTYGISKRESGKIRIGVGQKEPQANRTGRSSRREESQRQKEDRKEKMNREEKFRKSRELQGAGHEREVYVTQTRESYAQDDTGARKALRIPCLAPTCLARGSSDFRALVMS